MEVTMRKLIAISLLLCMLLLALSGCTQAPDKPDNGSQSNEPSKSLIEKVTMSDVKVDNEKANRWIFTVGDAKVHAQVNSSLPPLLMSFELVKTKVNVSATLGTFLSDPENNTGKFDAKRSVDLDSSNMIFYDVHRTDLDLVKLTFLDGNNIVGCALFTVECGTKLDFSLAKAVEFPKVDGNYQNITEEQVEAVFASVEGIGTVSLPKFPENVVANKAEIKRTGIFNNEVKLCGITVTGESWGLSSSVGGNGAPLKFVGVDKKVTVESANNNLISYLFADNGTWTVNESKKRFELSTDAVLHYSSEKLEKENFVDYVVITVYDGDDIVGCAVFSVFVNNLNFYYVVEGAVEFPKVDGKSQSITLEIVKAYAESVLS